MMKKKENRAVIDVLRPHFIFNTLNILRLMITKDSIKANKMVYDLSLYLRGHMEMLVCEETISIKEETSYAEAYLRLEQIAYPNLNFSYVELEEDYEVPAGCIQDLAEQLVKEYVRVTREKRTLILLPQYHSGELELWIKIPELDINKKINTNEREENHISSR